MEKSQTDRKIDLLKAIEFSNDFQMLSEVLLKWKKAKPTETIDKLINATIRMYYYSFNMEEEVRHMRKIVSEYRADKTRAVERARVADKKIETLEKKLKTLKL